MGPKLCVQSPEDIDRDGILSPVLGFWAGFCDRVWDFGRDSVTGSGFLGGILSPGLGFWAEFYTRIFEKGCIGARVPYTMLKIKTMSIYNVGTY